MELTPTPNVAPRVASTPLAIEVPRETNIDAILRQRLAVEPEAIYLEVRKSAVTPIHKEPSVRLPKTKRGSDKSITKGQKDDWHKVTLREFNDRVVAAAKGLVALGVQPGDRVGIMCRTRFEWTLLDFAAWAAGAVPVPIYETSSADQVQWIVSNSEISVLFVETEDNRATANKVRSQMPSLSELLVIDNGAIDMLTTIGKDVPTAEIERRRRLATTDDLATIIYTSGTTGRPKGAELTHGNFVILTLNAVAAVPVVFNGMGRTMLFLPLAHVFARFIEVLALAGGTTLAHSPDIKNLTDDLQGFKPTYILGVPRVFEKVYNQAEQNAAADKARPYWNWASRVAIEYSRALDTPEGPRPGLKFQRLFADGLVFSKLREKLGGKVEYAVSGGGPLGERLGHFYRGLGIKILEGYGLTETTAPTSVNRPEATVIGSVGQQLPGCEIKIADDGEIMLRGPHVFRGYHKNPEATAEAFDADGWFHTGDIGALDENGFCRITGRKKEIIVTAGGKNVAPAQLEDRVRAHALVSQCVVVGDNRPYIGALITLDAEGIPGWFKMHGKHRANSIEEVMTDPDVLASLDTAIHRANEAVSKAEQIRRYTVLAGDFTVENGYLTPSMKVRRFEVLRDFADDVEKVYDNTHSRELVAASA